MGSYSVKVRNLGVQLLDLICKGLGLESGYFNDELSSTQLMAINCYPPCPDPSLTLGLPKYSDINLLTLLLQGEMHGFQVWKDGQWFAIEPLPNALMVNIGHMLQEPSNVEKIMEIDDHIGCAMSGLIADARTLAEHARVETQVPIPEKPFVEDLKQIQEWKCSVRKTNNTTSELGLLCNPWMWRALV